MDTESLSLAQYRRRNVSMMALYAVDDHEESIATAKWSILGIILALGYILYLQHKATGLSAALIKNVTLMKKVGIAVIGILFLAVWGAWHHHQLHKQQPLADLERKYRGG